MKPFAHFSNEILMFLNFEEAAVKPFAHFSNEIFIFLSNKEERGVRRFAGLRQPVATCGGPSFAASRVRFEGSIRWLDSSIARCWRLAWS